MARYLIDGVVVDTERAKESYSEDTYWDGRNHISKATGSQWIHETLYLSKKNNYYIVKTSQWQGSSDAARFIDDREAAVWLLANGHLLPEALVEISDDVSE